MCFVVLTDQFINGLTLTIFSINKYGMNNCGFKTFACVCVFACSVFIISLQSLKSECVNVYLLKWSRSQNTTCDGISSGYLVPKSSIICDQPYQRFPILILVITTIKLPKTRLMDSYLLAIVKHL